MTRTTRSTTTASPEVPGLTPVQPDRDCPLCPRLCDFRHRHRAAQPDWFNAPVPSWGPWGAPLLIVGLAPGLRGANRTGRPFTGDFAGEVLYPALVRHGFARGTFAARPDDGLELTRCRITNAVRCVPPENKPTPPEIATCRRFLIGEVAGAAGGTGGGAATAGPRLILALGRIAHESALRALGLPVARHAFAHGAVHRLPAGQTLVDTYHTSRYNVNTGRLTPEMFEAVVAILAELAHGDGT